MRSIVAGVACGVVFFTWSVPGRASEPSSSGRSQVEESGRTAKNVVFLELGGNGLVYSVNYERFVSDNASLRIGAGYIGVGASAGPGSASASMLTIPLLGNYYLGSANHKLQLGLGLTLIRLAGTIEFSPIERRAVEASGSVVIPAPTGVVGYRYIPESGGLALFAGFTPFLAPGTDRTVVPWPGLSVGGVF